MAVNESKVKNTMLNCIQKVSSVSIRTLCQLNKAYKEAEHDLRLMETIGAITKKDVDETLDKMQYQYVEKGLKMSGYDED